MSYKRDYLSYSSLKAFDKGVNHYVKYVTKEKEPPSAAMRFGNAFHTYLLEPNEFDKRYHVLDQSVNKRKKEYKDLLASLESDGILPLDFDDMERIRSMNASVLSHKWGNQLCSEMAESYEQEVKGKINGYMFKGFADVIGASYVADLKTAIDGSPSTFIRQADQLGYHLQAAIYSQLTGKGFYWVVVESNYPHNVCVYTQTQEDYEKASEYLFSLVDRFVVWDGSYDHSGYSDEIIDLRIPSWSKMLK